MSGEEAERFLAAAPAPARSLLRLLVALGRRPRGAALLAHLPLAQQAAQATLALIRYDEPALACTLGWDAEAVVSRGRVLRHTEQRR